MSAPPSLGSVILSGAALMALYGTSWILSYIPLGTWSTVLALAIAVTKALLILSVFMGIQRQSVANRVVVATALSLILLLLGFVVVDVVRR